MFSPCLARSLQKLVAVGRDWYLCLPIHLPCSRGPFDRNLKITRELRSSTLECQWWRWWVGLVFSEWTVDLKKLHRISLLEKSDASIKGLLPRPPWRPRQFHPSMRGRGNVGIDAACLFRMTTR